MEYERWAKLEVWKLADELAYNTYIATRGFPKEEIYGITLRFSNLQALKPSNIRAFKHSSFLASQPG